MKLDFVLKFKMLLCYINDSYPKTDIMKSKIPQSQDNKAIWQYFSKPLTYNYS